MRHLFLTLLPLLRSIALQLLPLVAPSEVSIRLALALFLLSRLNAVPCIHPRKGFSSSCSHFNCLGVSCHV
uniref:Putative secreted protein n=1 Tax=Anopheles darlingi TaxID=43151 RepID=A0A2M4D033_ANODA